MALRLGEQRGLLPLRLVSRLLLLLLGLLPVPLGSRHVWLLLLLLLLREAQLPLRRLLYQLLHRGHGPYPKAIHLHA